jgi:alpha-galactosidase
VEARLNPEGVRLVGSDGRVNAGPCRPAVTFERCGTAERWDPPILTPGTSSRQMTAEGGPGGLTLLQSFEPASDGYGGIDVSVRLINRGALAVRVLRLSVLCTEHLLVGERAHRWRTYRNGHQSWSGTRAVGTAQRDADVPTRAGRLGVTDAAHRSPTGRGHVRSDALTAVVEPVSGDAVAMAFLDLADAFGYIEIVAPNGIFERLEAWSDLDGVALAPGASIVSRVRVCDASGPAAGATALRMAASAAGEAMGALGRGRTHPGGWCSWYYYFTKVTESDVEANLEVLAEDGRNGLRYGCEYVMVDDGHQRQLGDWLDADERKFPSGMARLADRIRGRGFDAGIWWAPFLVHPRSEVARTRPEWLVRTQRGRPIVGCLNPNWSLRRPMWVLDTTHPEVLSHLEHVASVIGHEWGYAVQKLDFLYAASLPGIRFDPSATRACSLRRGLDAVRRGAGDDSFLIGCGCPLGPAIGVVDAMRIGADVTPYWSNAIDRIGGRGRHGLATRNAVVNILTRQVLDGVWWLNDPDCMLVRDVDTRLTLEEVRTLATVVGMTDGMLVLSDRLDRVGDERLDVIRSARELSGGSCKVVDLFESSLPELLVSRHDGHLDVAVLNLSERPRRKLVELHRIGADTAPGRWRERWTGEHVALTRGVVDFGHLPPHSSRVIRIGTS